MTSDLRTPGPAIVRARSAKALIILLAIAAVGAVALWPVGLRGGLLALFVAGVLIGTLTMNRADRIGGWLRHASRVLMGGTMIQVVFHRPFGPERWVGGIALLALLIFHIPQTTATPRSGHRERR